MSAPDMKPRPIIGACMGRIRQSSDNAASQRATNLKGQGKEIISLAIGKRDFAVPDNVKQSIVEAMVRNRSRYTTVDTAYAFGLGQEISVLFTQA